MSQVTMSIGTFKEVALLLPPRTSVLLRANHGVGKSKVVRQVQALLKKQMLDSTVVDISKFKTLKEFMQVTDRRLSQMTEGDMIGLPSTDGETTRFNPPDWYKRACSIPMVLFLDELNRGTNEVMQAAFQIVLDRELNGWPLHPLTRVYAAINVGALYTVNEMDPALLDRFYVIDLETDVKSFCAWGRDKDPEQGGNLHPNIPDFIEQNQRHDGKNWLFALPNTDPGTVTVSPRSWEFVNHALVYAGIVDNPHHPMFYHIVRGFVGNEAAIAFQKFCKEVDNRITGEELVNKYHEQRVKSKVLRLGQGSQNEIVEKVATYVIKDLPKVSDQQGKNIKELMIDLPDELRISLWSKLTSQGIDKIDLAKSIHKHCAELVLGVFGVPMGEAGIGVVPNIPGIFRAPTKTPEKK